MGSRSPNQRQSIDNQNHIVWSDKVNSKNPLGRLCRLNHVRKSSLSQERNHCSVDNALLELNKNRWIKRSFMMGNPSNQRKESEAGKSPDHNRTMTESRPNTHLKDRMSYGVLIGPSSMFVYFLSILWHLEMKSQKGLALCDWVTDPKTVL